MVASSIASAITSPIGCSPAAFWPLGVSRADRMSAVMLPMTRFASGAESVVYLSRIALAPASGVTSWLTIRFVAVAAVILFDRWSIVRSMSVTRRPKEAALVTSLPAIVQMYGWCVWALTITRRAGRCPARSPPSRAR